MGRRIRTGTDMKRFGKNDLFLIFALLAACVAVYLMFSMGRKEGGSVVVSVDGKEYGSYVLFEEQTVEITDEDGHVTNVLVIQDGEAYMQSADCPDKLCVRQRAVRRAGESIVCLPNRVVAAVEGMEESGLDGFVQ